MGAAFCSLGGGMQQGLQRENSCCGFGSAWTHSFALEWEWGRGRAQHCSVARNPAGLQQWG